MILAGIAPARSARLGSTLLSQWRAQHPRPAAFTQPPCASPICTMARAQLSSSSGIVALVRASASRRSAILFAAASPTSMRGLHSTRPRPAESRPELEKVPEKAQSKVTEAVKHIKTATGGKGSSLSEDIYTIPNLLTTARLISVPFLGYFVLNGQMYTAATLLFFSGLTDVLDGWLARKYNSYTVFGSIADPAADKGVMTVMVVCLAIKGLLPMPLAVLILGRDVALVIAAFFIRYASLPPPKTFKRYWDFSLPSASVQPTQISKYNTFLQLLLVGASTIVPCLPLATQDSLAVFMTGFQWLVGATTLWSGLSYVFGKGAVTFITRK